MIFKLVDKNDNFWNLKIGIWLYIFLLIFEGSLRKWIFPSLASPLLIVRDPVAFYILFKAFQMGILKKNRLIILFPILGFIAFIAALFFGHGNLSVALYGLRPFILHFPLGFVIGIVFNRADVLNVGKVFIHLSIMMIILNIFQFYSPQSSWINIGVGGDVEGSGFGGAMGYFRPSGTFSFINGLSLFYGLTSAFVFYFLYQPKQIGKLILILAILTAILSIPFTISRTVLFQNILCFIFSFLIIVKNPKHFKTLFFSSFILIIIMFLFFNNEYLQTGLEVFSSRFESASESEGGLKGTLFDRMFVTLWDGIINSTNASTFGDGLGSNSNVGNKLLKINAETRISDYEWVRTISEIGPILGILLILFRLKILLSSFLIAIKKTRINDFLPWMLLSFGFIQILQGQMAQPTSVGFITLIIGLIYANFKKDPKIKDCYQ
jgi:hypothetical protein